MRCCCLGDKLLCAEDAVIPVTVRIWNGIDDEARLKNPQRRLVHRSQASGRAPGVQQYLVRTVELDFSGTCRRSVLQSAGSVDYRVRVTQPAPNARSVLASRSWQSAAVGARSGISCPHTTSSVRYVTGLRDPPRAIAESSKANSAAGCVDGEDGNTASPARV
jgi:hypothetical protein